MKYQRTGIARDVRSPFQKALDSFVEELNQNEVEYTRAIGRGGHREYVAMNGGRKYVRIVTIEAHIDGRCAYCFVEYETGNIFKPAGWRGPERNFPRGNIYEATRLEWCGIHGINNA